ncbi:MAG: XRE family transcriptional regulator [Halothiobacillaceae bacterium]
MTCKNSDAKTELGRQRPSSADKVGRFGERLRIAIAGRSQRAVAEAAGLSHGTVYSILNGSLPNLLSAVSLADVLGVRLEWLAEGTGPMRRAESDQEAQDLKARLDEALAHGKMVRKLPDGVIIEEFAHAQGMTERELWRRLSETPQQQVAPTPPETAPEAPHKDEYAYLPLYDVHAAAGDGRYNDQERIKSQLAFRRDWIHNELHANPAHLHLIYVSGQSMEPLLKEGDVVMVDSSGEGAIRADGIYVIRLGAALLCKRIQRLPGRKIRISSENPAYEAFEVDLNAPADDLQIVGRAVWHGGLM